MKNVLQIISSIDRPSGIKSYSEGFFSHPKLKDKVKIESFGLSEIKGINSLVMLMKKMKSADIIYNHELYSIKAIIFFIIGTFLRKKIIIVSHGNLIVEANSSSRIKKYIFLVVLKLILFFSKSKVQFLNIKEKERSFKLTKESFICPPYCKINSENRIIREKKEGYLKFCYLGAFYYKRKGFDRMLAFIKSMKNYDPNCTLDLIGIEPTKGLINEIRSLGLINCINFIKPIYGQGKLELLSHYDGLLLFSRSEGWPIVVQEACQLALPVIVSKSTNVSDIVKKENIGIIADFDELSGTCKYVHQYFTTNKINSENYKKFFSNIENHKGFDKFLNELEI